MAVTAPVSAQRVAFEVPGIPQPQGSKSFKGLRGGKPILLESNDAVLKPWRDSLITAARAARQGAATMNGPIEVRVSFYLPRPAGHFGKRGLRLSAPALPIGARRDLDKLCRALLDALKQAGVYHDDGQVVELLACKRYADPMTIVVVRVLRGEQ